MNKEAWDEWREDKRWGKEIVYTTEWQNKPETKHVYHELSAKRGGFFF